MVFSLVHFILVIQKKKINVGNNIFHYVKTIQMLNIEHFKLKHQAKASCPTGSALNGHENTHLKESTCTKIWEKSSIITGIVQPCD